MTTYLIIWGILPFLLLILTIWSWIKLRILKKDREQISFYGKQFLFTAVALLLSFFILSSGLVELINENVFFDIVEDSFLEWLIYPVVLLVLAKLGPKAEG